MQLSPDSEFRQNFVRTAKWCPDGSTFLAQCENRSFQFFDTPELSYQDFPAHSEKDGERLPGRVFTQASPIVDFVWYPTASLINPASFCFLASVRECPVKLLDASDGRLRASYSIVDHRERQIAPHSMAFNLSADRLYCGFEDAIEVFDVSRPGEGTRLPTTPSKKSKDGLKGIISAVAFLPSQGSDMYAAGSLSPTTANIAMFCETQGPEPTTYVSGGPPAAVTQIHFNPARPHIMYAAYRRHAAIYSWDLRADVTEPVKIYQCGDERGRTNQKLRFDVDLSGRWLSTGDQHGNILMFDLQDAGLSAEMADDGTWKEAEEITPPLVFKAHGDAVGSVGFHPLRPVLLSASGSRHFDIGEASESSESEDSDTEIEEAAPEDVPRPRTGRIRLRCPHPVTLDASIKLWSFDSETSISQTEIKV
ncbi:putative WD40 repeat-like protein [Lyophyllum shimeji]|uniref:WD40 repeat-like protein n=1 Tax=Lyophyllum shimeji TaxID=47721 RepID=A0A9P3PWQ8_LYOSH|nr:putative WD40 repeat-like protein [Lyophyllum shimeji]